MPPSMLSEDACWRAIGSNDLKQLQDLSGKATELIESHVLTATQNKLCHLLLNTERAKHPHDFKKGETAFGHLIR